jgi:tetratricopeptide (TPR) repeat protein
MRLAGLSKGTVPSAGSAIDARASAAKIVAMEEWQREHLETIAEHRRQGLGWRYGEMQGWTTEAIFAYLQKLGIDTDVGRFPAQAAAAGYIRALCDSWTSQIAVGLEQLFAEDFPLIAIPILWERLTPDLACPEIVSERIYRVIRENLDNRTLPDVNGLPARISAALGLVRYLQQFPTPERPDQFDEVCRDSIYDYAEWLLELVEIYSGRYPDAVLEIADVMADCTDSMSFEHEAAMVLANTGKREQAIERTAKFLERYGKDLWARIFAGDIYVALGEEAEAIRHFTLAFELEPKEYEWEAVADRLRDVCKSPEQKAELAEILRRHPNPKPVIPREPRPISQSRPASAPTPKIPRLRPPTAVAASATKIGRNDPCPCGSGKKYKKCCLR